MVDCYLGSN